MFTGIIESVGKILSISSLGKGFVFWIDVKHLSDELAIGDSISINGVCSTVVEKKESLIKVDYLEETLSKTSFSSSKVNDHVNLECAVTPTTKLSGHVVTGHVDCKGVLLEKKEDGPWTIITIEYPEHYFPLLLSKGSISLHGISLTVVDVTRTTFTCHIIPHTLSETCLGTLSVSDTVNLEFDQVGKYLFKFYMINETDRVSLYEKLKL
jgi:riboflavin synthase